MARADGSVETWGRPGTLIGRFDEYKATSTTAGLRAGDTLVFYTDGVTDVRPPHNLTSADLADLVGHAARSATSADEVADRLHAALSGGLPIEERTDDIALLIVRAPDANATGDAGR